MSIGSTNFHPSAIEDVIYNILDSDPDYLVSSQDYTKDAIDEVVYFMNEQVQKDANFQYDIIEDLHPDMCGGSVSFCWIEAGHLHHIVLSYRYI